ncbi:MAG: addiction module protein [Pseudomonadales bacterium]|nr:addiction module protein [Pseudomonadales bacterium]MCP5188077.1 addiction module protein [Pseudomonadales bacterium]
MSTEMMERLRSEALMLSMPERAELAHDLLESLDAPADEGVEDAWDEEIIRRIAQIDAGQATLLSREQLRQKLQDRLGNV